MQSDTVARLVLDKGFGFIRDEHGVGHFFNRGSVRGVVLSYCGKANALSLRPKNRRGTRAGDVRVVDE